MPEFKGKKNQFEKGLNCHFQPVIRRVCPTGWEKLQTHACPINTGQTQQFNFKNCLTSQCWHSNRINWSSMVIQALLELLCLPSDWTNPPSLLSSPRSKPISPSWPALFNPCTHPVSKHLYPSGSCGLWPLTFRKLPSDVVSSIPPVDWGSRSVKEC
jgi:hypothetical protein